MQKCSHCMAGKQTRVSFKKHPPSRKSELLELVHSDVCGPLKVKSFSGALYFVTFIDIFPGSYGSMLFSGKVKYLKSSRNFMLLLRGNQARS